MQDVTDSSLETMSVAQLQAFHAEVQSAIRAVIRRRNEAKAAVAAPVAAPPRPPVDLERERDTWLANRRR